MKTHITIAAAVALALAAGVHAQQTRDQGAAASLRVGTAVISGTVVTDEQTPQPVRRVAVSVANADGSVNRTTFTDETGRFSLTALPDGRYTLAASKAPFIRTAYGAKRPDLPGTPITLANGSQMTDIVLRLARGAVLSGRVTDENGEPAFGVNVRVMQMRMQFGERSFVPVVTGSSSESTDDRGMYRLFGLPPGEYMVTAVPRMTAGEVRAMTESEIRAVMQALQQQQTAAQTAQQNSGQRPAVPSVNPAQAGANAPQQPMSDAEKVTVAYAPVYYPGTTVGSSATTVTLAAGEERTGVDFPLRLVRTTTVEGIVVLPAGIPPQSVQLMMVPSSPGGPAGMAGTEIIGMQRVSVGPDGKFTYTAVAPGQYTISARATKSAGGAPGPPPPPPPPPPPAGAQMMTFTSRVVGAGGGEPMMNDMVMMMGDQGGGGTQYWAMADVPVDGTPIQGVTLALQPGMTISGKIEFRSGMTRPGGDLKRTQLNLMPAPSGGGLRITTSLPVATVDETGHFTITGVTPGRYRLTGVSPVMQGSGPGQPWRIGSAVIKGRDVLDFMLDVAPNEDITDAVITFIDTTQEVRGSLQDASGRPAPDYTIVVFAADKAYWTPQSRRIRTARPGTDGKFTVINLPAGDYRMAAVVDIAPTDINDPAFLEQLVGASFAITLGPGEQKTQDLKIKGGL